MKNLSTTVQYSSVLKYCTVQYSKRWQKIGSFVFLTNQKTQKFYSVTPLPENARTPSGGDSLSSLTLHSPRLRSSHRQDEKKKEKGTTPAQTTRKDIIS